MIPWMAAALFQVDDGIARCREMSARAYDIGAAKKNEAVLHPYAPPADEGFESPRPLKKRFLSFVVNVSVGQAPSGAGDFLPVGALILSELFETRSLSRPLPRSHDGANHIAACYRAPAFRDAFIAPVEKLSTLVFMM